MADQPVTAAKKSKKKSGGIVNIFRDMIKRPKPTNDSARQSNSTRDPVSSAFGAHDPVPESETTTSGKYIDPILLSSTTTPPSL